VSRGLESLLSVVVMVAATVIAYRLGIRDAKVTDRGRAFMEGWNVGYDCGTEGTIHALIVMGALESDPREEPVDTSKYAVSETHRSAQLRAAQEGRQ
jgi:hypothetical protein